MSAHSPSDSQPASGAEPVASASGKVPVPISTPVKNRGRLRNLKGIEKAAHIQDAPTLPLDEFLKEHLSNMPDDYTTSSPYWHRAKLPSIVNSVGAEQTLYQPICSLLNAISNRIHSKPYLP